MTTSTLPPHLITATVSAALAEDLGLAGDLTTNAVIEPHWTATASINSRDHGTVSGITVARAAFLHLDQSVEISDAASDGDRVKPGDTIMTVAGNARAILSAERTALNFLGRMSGIASLTRRYVDTVSGTNATIVDTRKTTPGLRALEKYAVRCGGGMNHRVGLFDAVLIKDNHIAIAGGIAEAIAAAKRHVGHMVKIEVEVDTLEQLDKALANPVDAVLLDNMPPDVLQQAVSMCAGKITTEASGGINLDTVRAVAEAGVDLISVGALTHSVTVMDFGLDSQVRKIEA